MSRSWIVLQMLFLWSAMIYPPTAAISLRTLGCKGRMNRLARGAPGIAGLSRPLRSTSTSTDASSSPSSSSLVNGRESAAGVALDVNLIATRPDMVRSHLRARRVDDKIIASVDEIVSLRQERNSLISRGDAAKASRNSLSQRIGQLMKTAGAGVEVAELKGAVEAAAAEASSADAALSSVDAAIQRLTALMPNLLDDRVPDGDDETANIVQREWGSATRKVGEGFKWHDDLAAAMGGLRTDAAARISGARFSVLVGPIARLERALTQMFLDFHVSRGYTEVAVPYIVSRSTLEGTGQLPKFEADLFRVSHSVGGEDAFLIPTAEVPVTSLFRGQLLEPGELPVRLVCHSPCFRAEAGSYGRDTRGLLRQHQFNKVEMVRICSAAESSGEHEAMVRDAEALLEALELPYRRVLLCSGDIGFSANICFDLEVWLPGQQAYREIASISNCGEFQSRRMGLRHRVTAATDKKSAAGRRTTLHPHTLNGSGVAVGRALVAVLENYQESDGRVRVPAVLRPYLGGREYVA